MDSRPLREPSTTGPAVDPFNAAFRTLAEHVDFGVIVLDAAGAPLYANAPARHLLCGRDTPDDGSDQPLSLPAELRGGPTGVSGTSEFGVQLPDEPQPRRVRATRIALPGEGHGAVLLLEDSSRSAAARTSLELASRLRTWALFRVVHNLKQPLNVLSLQLELLKQPADSSGSSGPSGPSGAGATPTLVEHVTKAQNEVLRFGRELDVLASLLAPAESAAPASFDVGPFLAELARRLASALQVARVQMETDLPATPLPVRARRQRLQQAVLNVLQNALEATPRGGTLRLSARAGDGAVSITVRDEGAGMSPAHLARAFELHYSTRPDATGIGLFVARSLLESEGGRIELTSRPGEGTIAEISIPNG